MRLRSFLAIVAAVAAAPGAGAQVLQPWGDPAPRAVSVDVLRPAFDGGGTSLLTTINQLGVRWRVGRVVLVGELPVVIAKVDGAPSGATLLGNPFVGVATNPDSPLFGEVGVRIPVVRISTGQEGIAAEVGILGDFADFEAYGEDIVAIRATGGVRYRSPEHLVVRAALRPTLMVPINEMGSEAELFLDYAFQAGYEETRFTAGIVYNGRLLITEPDLALGERTIPELGLGGSIILGRWRPGVVIRLPLDDELSEVVRPSVGLKLEVTW